MHIDHGIAARATPIFRSFWIASFDGNDHLAGLPDAADADSYRRNVLADYRRARDAGIRCVRENVGWRNTAPGGTLDFAAARVRAECAADAGVQIVWTLCRGSWPDDVDVASDRFVESFRAFAGAAAQTFADVGSHDEPPVYTPIDEISFTSWALAETSLFGPNRTELRGRVVEIRRQLVRAAIAGCDAILEVAPLARFVHHEAALTTATFDAPLLGDAQFVAWDMLAGRLEPALGGHPRYLTAADIHWHGGEPSRGVRGEANAASSTPHWYGALSRLIHDVHARYRCAVAISRPIARPPGVRSGCTNSARRSATRSRRATP